VINLITIFYVVANSAVQTYNAALNRTAYQSSTHFTTIDFPARYGNDGRRKGPCAITSIELNPWWAVDLGQPTAVYRVDLTTHSGRKNNITGFSMGRVA